MSADRPDLVQRYLGAVVRLLPAGRRDWGRAMTAELPTIDGSAARWRFALGCTAAALRQLGGARAGGHPALTVVVIAAALAVEAAGAELIGETVPLLVMLSLLIWRSVRPGLFGPARPGMATWIVRAGIYLVAALGLVFVADSHRAGLLDRGDKAPFFSLLLTFLVAVFLSITASSAALQATGLAAGVGAGAIGGLAGFLVLPFDRFAPPLVAGWPGHGSWLAVVVFAAPVAAAAITLGRSGRADQAVIAALCAGTVAAVVTAMLSLTGIALFPGQIPDFVGPVMVPGTPLAERLAADATEASDPAAGLLAFAALLGAILWVVARSPLRRWKLILLAPLSYLPITFAASSDNFPGISYILMATWVLVVAALIVTAAPALAATPVRDHPPARPA